MDGPDSQRNAAESGFSVTESRLLQQRLIDSRATLDRQVGQLKRLNDFSNRLLTQSDDRFLAALFAEAIVDILDVEGGAAWLMDEAGSVIEHVDCGFPDGFLTSSNGPPIHDQLDLRRSQGIRLDRVAQQQLLGDGFAMSAVARGGMAGAKSVILLCGNTVAHDGIYGQITDEMVTLLVALADKCAARLASVRSQHIIETQLDSIRRSEERLMLVLESTDEGWWDWQPGTGECLYSAHWQMMMGNPIEGTYSSGPFWADRIHPGDRPNFDVSLRTAARDGNDARFELELRLKKADGSWLPVMARAIVHRDADGELVRLAGSIQDLSERKANEERIHRLAYYDALTGLPNRRLFESRLAVAIETAARTQSLFAVLMLDVDRFKQLNDSHGHDAGDELLKVLGYRLQEAVRADDTVTRLGGDEFAILLQGLGADETVSKQNAMRVGDKVLSAASHPVLFAFGSRQVSCSVGVAVSSGETTTQSILKNADVALYQAKEAGRACVQLFDPAMQARVEWQSGVEQRLQTALEAGAFAVHYQPIVDIESNLAGVEALLRCQSPDGGLMSPSEFIPVAQESGLIHRLGALAMQTSLRQYRTWEQAGRLPPGFRISVNVSAVEFLRDDFPARVAGMLAAEGVPGHAICLEITEATVVRDLGVVAGRMQVLRSLGVEFSLDDFGTGYASLAYLRRLPISEVKIDRSYVVQLPIEEKDRALVSSVVRLCHALGLRVVAEGVETEEQRDLLVGFGCERYQGFHFGKAAVPPEDPRGLLLQVAARDSEDLTSLPPE